jgi:hypothetical protein
MTARWLLRVPVMTLMVASTSGGTAAEERFTDVGYDGLLSVTYTDFYFPCGGEGGL